MFTMIVLTVIAVALVVIALRVTPEIAEARHDDRGHVSTDAIMSELQSVGYDVRSILSGRCSN